MFDVISISSLAVFIPALAGVLFYARLPRPGRIITWLFCAWFIAEAIAHFALRLNGISNWWVYFMVSLVEMVLITLFYKSIYRNTFAKQLIVWLAWLGLVVIFGEYGILHKPMGPISMLYSCIFFFAMGLWTFYEIVMLNAEEAFVWINVGLMLLFMGSAVYFSTWQFMMQDIPLFRLFTHVHAYLLVACYLIFTIGLWRSRSSSY
jgi:hypothetical protein